MESSPPSGDQSGHPFSAISYRGTDVWNQVAVVIFSPIFPSVCPTSTADPLTTSLKLCRSCSHVYTMIKYQALLSLFFSWPYCHHLSDPHKSPSLIPDPTVQSFTRELNLQHFKVFRMPLSDVLSRVTLVRQRH